jgi:spore germination protein KA
LRTEDLRYEYFTLGETSGTACCLCYLEQVVDRRALAELRRRLSKVRIDGVLDSNYVAELISDSRLAPVRTTGTTERPDVVAAKLLEGRIAILVDGSPVVVTVPHILLELFQAGEDYYVNYAFAAINRFLRIMGFILSISVAPVYLALVGYHQELLPLPLLLSISQATQGVPFPAMVEVLLLLFQFEVLREAGSRTTSSLGQTLSVVGGLVIGQSAVEAKLVAAPTLIVVAFSGITGLIAPKLKSAVFLSRLFLILLANFYGIYGYFIGAVVLLAWLARLQSFGVPMLSGLPLSRKGSGEDSYLRPPFAKMKKFGRFLAGYGRKL